MKIKNTHILALLIILSLTLIISQNASSQQPYPKYYNQGYSYGYNFVRQHGNIPADASGNGSCSPQRIGVSSHLDEGNAYTMGCKNGRRDAAANLPPNLSSESGVIPAEQIQEQYNKAYKYCSTNYAAINVYDTECCADKINQERIRQGLGVDFQKIVWDATRRLDINECISRQKVTQYGYNKAYSALELTLRRTESASVVDQVCTCTGNAVADRYIQYPGPSMKYLNNIFLEEIKLCQKNSSYIYSGSNTTQTTTSTSQEPQNTEDTQQDQSQQSPSISETTGQINENVKDVKETIDNLKSIFE